MHIRKATRADCRALAELALLAGEGIPAFFWGEARQPGQDINMIAIYPGYRVVQWRAVVPRPCHPYTGDLVLLTRAVA